MGQFWYPAYYTQSAGEEEVLREERKALSIGQRVENLSKGAARFLIKELLFCLEGEAPEKEGFGEADPSYKKYSEGAAAGGRDGDVESETDAGRRDGDLKGGIKPETAAGAAAISPGLPAGGKEYVREQLADYDFLMKHFYVVHPTAAAGRELMRAEDFLKPDFALEVKEAPQILIYHTHSQEEYADYRDGNREATIVGVGDYLAELLRDRGYRVIHDRSVYDLRDGKLDRSRAYTYALEGITAILQKYPSIEVVLDLHRDGVSENTRLVTEIDGKKTATVMFFNGTSETPDGEIEYLHNPYLKEDYVFEELFVGCRVLKFNS